METTGNQQQGAQKVCSGDCLLCPVQQRIYCASQNSRNTLGMVDTMTRKLNDLETMLLQLRDKVYAQASEEGVFKPTHENKETPLVERHLSDDKHREGGGADNRLP